MKLLNHVSGKNGVKIAKYAMIALIVKIVVGGIFSLIAVPLAFNAVNGMNNSEVAKVIETQKVDMEKQFSNPVDNNGFSVFLENADKNPNHVYYPSNINDFVEATQKGNELIAKLKELPWNQREEDTAKLRELLEPLMAKYAPGVKLSSLDDESVQSVFYFGQKDLRFGMLFMNWNIHGGEEALNELLAFDSSNVGFKLFESYQNYDQVKYELIHIWNYGPFED